MRIKFKPMPWLTVLTLICLGILIALGTWQYQRLEWKTNLIAEIDAAAEADPISDLSVVVGLSTDKKPVDFRRVSLSGEFVEPSVNNGDPFHLIMPDGKSLQWRLLQPFKTEDGLVYVATHIFPDAQKQNPPSMQFGSQNVVGYARIVRPSSSFAPVSNPDTNHWYVFNSAPDVLDWSDVVEGRKIPTGFYIDWVSDQTTATDLPVKKPELRNNHLDYMLTWYSFALILLIIYFILHKRAGRLSFKD